MADIKKINVGGTEYDIRDAGKVALRTSGSEIYSHSGSTQGGLTYSTTFPTTNLTTTVFTASAITNSLILNCGSSTTVTFT